MLLLSTGFVLLLSLNKANLVIAGKHQQSGTVPLHPVILVPGDGGSQIEARLNKTSGHWWCSKNSDWYDLWLNINQMLEPEVMCWSDNVALQYDPVTHTTRSGSSMIFLSSTFLNLTSIPCYDCLTVR